jgi:hypothetical protein
MTYEGTMIMHRIRTVPLQPDGSAADRDITGQRQSDGSFGPTAAASTAGTASLI